MQRARFQHPPEAKEGAAEQGLPTGTMNKSPSPLTKTRSSRRLKKSSKKKSSSYQDMVENLEPKVPNHRTSIGHFGSSQIKDTFSTIMRKNGGTTLPLLEC